jgi:L-alanine-DL-glutamate epimerase-like enolase superfamily enzyme
VQYVNHTFTSNLALSASLQPFADAAEGCLAEVPVSPSALARSIGGPTWTLDPEGCIRAPETPGLGVEVSEKAIEPYRQEIEIRFRGQTIWPISV